VLHGLEPFQPLLTGRSGPQLGHHRFGVVGDGEGLLQPELHRRPGQRLELLVGPEQVDLHARHHLGDGQVGDAGEGLFAEPEVVEVGGVAQVQELEVVLPQLEGEVDEPVVGDDEGQPRPCPVALGDDLDVLLLGEGFEAHGLHLVDEGPHLLHPLAVEAVPVAEVEAGPLEEVGNPGLDLGGIGHPHGRQVGVAVEDARIHAEGGGNQVVARVVLGEGGDGVLEEGGVPGSHDLGPVDAVLEPEHGVLVGPAVLGEHHVVGVELLPPLGTGGRLDLKRAREPVAHRCSLLSQVADLGRVWMGAHRVETMLSMTSVEVATGRQG
jgi:hypothetical protein